MLAPEARRHTHSRHKTHSATEVLAARQENAETILKGLYYEVTTELCFPRPLTDYATDPHAQDLFSPLEAFACCPIIRPPREFQELAGSKAAIYQTVHDGELVFSRFLV